VTRLLRTLVVLCTVALAPSPWLRAAQAQHEEPNSPRASAPLTILQVNDVYSTVPIDGLGGVARLATVKARMTSEGRTPLVLLAGDFLSPSVASSVFKGEQMVAALNAAGLDMATLGNHEFDFGVDVLLQRMAEAKWQWVISNVIDTSTERPVGGAAPYVVRKFGAMTVGFIGLCLSNEIESSRLERLRLIDPLEAAAIYVPQLKQEGAQVIIALTHLSFADDRALAARFPEIDLIVGGHEHYPITAVENRTFISKAGSEGRFIARIDVNRSADGMVERFFELMPVDDSIPDDPATKAVIDKYEARLLELDVPVGTSLVPLDADSNRLRAGETNLGNLVADAMRAEVGADIALINAGSIRGERIFPAGPIYRRTLATIHPFGNIVCKIETTGERIRAALENGASRMPLTDGRFAQVSGLTYRVDPSAAPGRRIREVTIGGQPLDPRRTYTVAITDFQIHGGDDFVMFRDQPVLVSPESGPLLVSTLEKYVSARGRVSPSVEGRITVLR
jgi:5'-nucleotidase